MSSIRSYRYRVVDVFTDRPLEGNPLAVFPDASGLNEATMQKIARELNLSETAFVSPATQADCAAKVRIFTPTRELSFAGHPTVGTGFVLIDEGVVPADKDRFLLEEKIGPVAVRVESGERPLIWLSTPPITYGRTFDRTRCALALGLDPEELLEIAPQLLSAGNPMIYIAVTNEETVDRARLDLAGMMTVKDELSGPVGVFVFAPTPAGAYSRMFGAELGIVEDPATGSATGPLAAYMLRHDLVSGAAGTRFVSEQGVRMGCRSLLHVLLNGEQGADGIEVGGHVVSVVEATMRI